MLSQHLENATCGAAYSDSSKSALPIDGLNSALLSAVPDLAMRRYMLLDELNGETPGNILLRISLRDPDNADMWLGKGRRSRLSRQRLIGLWDYHAGQGKTGAARR